MQISQKALIKKSDKYLILLRSDNHPVFGGYWDLPGGRLEDGEELEEGLKREVNEETSLDIDVSDRIFKPEMTVFDKPTTFYVYEIANYSGAVTLSKDHSEFRWVTVKELKKMLIFPYILVLLKHHILK